MNVAGDRFDTVHEFRIEDEPALDGHPVIAVYGDVDQYVAPQLRDRLGKATDGADGPLLVDLSRVTFIDSMALGVLLGAHKRARAAGRDLRLVVPDNEIRRIFEITLLDRIFLLARTRDEALANSAESDASD